MLRTVERRDEFVHDDLFYVMLPVQSATISLSVYRSDTPPSECPMCSRSSGFGLLGGILVPVN